MTRYEVSCVNKSDRYNPHEFFVRVGSREVRVIVAESRYGNKYIKTEADGEQPNNLLSLPECPR